MSTAKWRMIKKRKILTSQKVNIAPGGFILSIYSTTSIDRSNFNRVKLLVRKEKQKFKFSEFLRMIFFTAEFLGVSFTA